MHRTALIDMTDASIDCCDLCNGKKKDNNFPVNKQKKAQILAALMILSTLCLNL